MSRQSESITRQDLTAYVDGELDAVRKTLVEEYLREHPDEAERLSQHQQYHEGLHTLFDPVLREPVPERLLQAKKQAGSGRLASRSMWPIGLRNAAVLFLTLTLGTVMGWIAHEDLHKPEIYSHSLVEDAFTSHVVYAPEIRHPVEVGSANEAHLFAWLSKRLKTRIRAPKLNAVGYELLGGRLLGSDGAPAAQFMYQSAEGRRLTLFLRHKKTQENEMAFRFAKRDNMRGFYWIDGELSYALIGEIDKSQLYQAAHLVYTSLN